MALVHHEMSKFTRGETSCIQSPPHCWQQNVDTLGDYFKVHVSRDFFNYLMDIIFTSEKGTCRFQFWTSFCFVNFKPNHNLKGNFVAEYYFKDNYNAFSCFALTPWLMKKIATVFMGFLKFHRYHHRVRCLLGKLQFLPYIHVKLSFPSILIFQLLPIQPISQIQGLPSSYSFHFTMTSWSQFPILSIPNNPNYHPIYAFLEVSFI